MSKLSNVVRLPVPAPVPPSDAEIELAAMLAQYSEARAEAKALEKRIADMRDGLLARLPEGSAAEACGFKVSVGRMPPTRTFNRKAFEAENTELCEWIDRWYTEREGALIVRVTGGAS